MVCYRVATTPDLHGRIRGHPDPTDDRWGVDFAWWVPYFLAHCNYWMIFGALWSHLEIPIDLRYFISVLSYGP